VVLAAGPERSANLAHPNSRTQLLEAAAPPQADPERRHYAQDPQFPGPAPSLGKVARTAVVARVPRPLLLDRRPDLVGGLRNSATVCGLAAAGGWPPQAELHTVSRAVVEQRSADALCWQ